MNDNIEQSETIEVSYSESLKKSVIAALQTVYDPEMESINVYDLGLIYELEVSEAGDVVCRHTLTSMMCPFADQICQDITDAIKSVDGVSNVDRELVFDPPFSTDMVSEDSKMLMGLW